MKKEIRITDKNIKGFMEYLREQEKSKSTISSYKRELFSLQMFLDEKPLTKSSLLAYKEIISAQYAPSSCNVSISDINGFLGYIGRKDLAIKPVRVQRKVFEEAGKELTKSDYNKLIRAAQVNGQGRLSLIIQTICSTGIRVSELQHITAEAIMTGKATITCKGKAG